MKLVTAASCILLLSTVVVVQGEPKTRQTDRKSISLTELRDGNVIGYCGHPLGTAIEVSGVYEMAEGQSPTKGIEEVLSLKIEVVNRTPLEKPVFYEYRPLRKGKNAMPEVGTKFKFAGYETGEWRGGVFGIEKFGFGSGQNHGYCFIPRFELVKDLTVRTSKTK